MDNNSKLEIAGREIKSITYLGAAINVILSAIKIIVGFFVGSLALIADGLHSLSDLATDIAVVLGVRLGSKAPDSEHPYGHGRAETFSSGLVAMVLIFVGGGMMYYATVAIAKDEKTAPSFAVLVVATISIASKEWLYRATQKIAIRSHSSALYANAWHHRSDALSSVAVLAGFISLELGFDHGDHVAAIAVGLMIVLVGVRVIGDCLHELTESAVDSGTIEHIRDIINADASIRQWHKLRSRMVGREVFLDLHILVDPDLNIAAAHEIAENLEKAVTEQISQPVNITVHVEPDIPELRKTDLMTSEQG